MAATAPVDTAEPSGRDSVPLALVIGNTDYGAFPKLQICDVSANLVASVLSRAGFRVVRQASPSNARLGTAIATLGEEAASEPGGRPLIYVCGYAVTYADRLFLVPVEARLERDADVLSQGIIARLLVGSVAAPSTAAGLLLMDVAAPPGKGRLDFNAMLRPADSAHVGLAAASLPTDDDQRPAPLAGALTDLVASGRLELGAAVGALSSRPGVSRSLLFARPPAEPSWLLGGPPAASSMTASAKPATPVPASLNPAERRRIQLSLQQLGYFKGRITGVFGADTLAAVHQFQLESGAEAKGSLTAQQAQRLLQ